MKKCILAVAIAIIAGAFQAKAIDLKDLLGKAGGAVSGIVDGLLTQSDITVAQMAGNWTASGSAIAFKSDNFLKQAGGSAAASAIEAKLDPYFQQYGLTGSTLDIDSVGNFTLKVKNIPLKGVITKRQDGNFDFTFTPVLGIKVGSIPAYVEKPSQGLNVMFDANKLKSLLSTLVGFTGSSLASAAGSLLDSYDGMLVGFAYTGTSTYNPASSGQSSGSGLGSSLLNGILKGNSGSGSGSGDASTPAQTNDTTSNNNENAGSLLNKAGGLLQNLFGK